MSRILKSPYVSIDNDNKVSIEVVSPEVLQTAQNLPDTMEPISPEAECENAKVIANQIISEAEMQAKQFESNARKIADNLMRVAKEDGWSQGHQEGYDKGMQEAEVIKKEAEQIRLKATAEREQLHKSMEPELVKLILGIVNKLLTDSVNINPNVIIYLIRLGLSSTNIQGDISIHVSEADYDTVINNKDTFISLTDASANVEIIKDFSLNKADCIIETPFGDIDCSLDQQHNALKKNIYYILENR